MTGPSIKIHSKADPNHRVLVARFGSPNGAKSGLEQLKGAGSRLGNAAVIEREADGKVGFTETQDWGIGKSALVGAVAAMILPGVGMVLGALAGGVAAHLIDLGFPDKILTQMGSGLENGTSMLVVLVHQGDLARAEELLTAGGATVLGSGVDADLGALSERLRQGDAPA